MLGGTFRQLLVSGSKIQQATSVLQNIFKTLLGKCNALQTSPITDWKPSLLSNYASRLQPVGITALCLTMVRRLWCFFFFGFVFVFRVLGGGGGGKFLKFRQQKKKVSANCWDEWWSRCAKVMERCLPRYSTTERTSTIYADKQKYIYIYMDIRIADMQWGRCTRVWLSRKFTLGHGRWGVWLAAPPPFDVGWSFSSGLDRTRWPQPPETEIVLDSSFVLDPLKYFSLAYVKIAVHRRFSISSAAKSIWGIYGSPGCRMWHVGNILSWLMIE